MMRAVVGVIVGYAVWTVLWLGGNNLLFGAVAEAVGAGQRSTVPGTLVGVIGLSVVCSLGAGLTTARIAKNRSGRALLAVGVLLLATGIGVQAGVWNLMPAWYHVTFLALLVPWVFAGGKLARVT